MSALNSGQYDGELTRIATTTDSTVVRTLVAALFWKMMRDHWDQSVKGKIGGLIPYSIKLAKTRPLFEAIFGPDPYRT